MRHELPNLRGAFSEPGAIPAAPASATPAIIVGAFLAFGFLVCLARVLFV
ncbi:hypothetical protein MesoLj131c_62170 [Mesorhizobium sp. 131-3-5]|nr:hypothetical protein [Mesorhizobium sp. 131-3-5]BCH11959.1 hypothetical protein MesoLj131c_62170 [Mesorhizobium sp. 131-3-5]